MPWTVLVVMKETLVEGGRLRKPELKMKAAGSAVCNLVVDPEHPADTLFP